MKKGRPFLVEGRLKLDQWEDKNTHQKQSKLKVVLESFSFIDSNGGDSAAPAAPRPPSGCRRRSRGSRRLPPRPKRPNPKKTTSLSEVHAVGRSWTHARRITFHASRIISHMAKTEVILTHNIVGLGGESDQVKVAAGYARNYLVPAGPGHSR